MFRYLVLGLLRRGAPRHGYALMKEYRDRAGIQVSTGNFYRELARLVTEGLVRTAHNPPGTDPRRAPYEITDAGAAAFDVWLHEPLGPLLAGQDDGLSARAVFLADTEPGVVAAVLDRWQEELWLKGKVLERGREQALAAARSGDGVPHTLPLLLARRLKHIAADLEFVDEVRATMASPTPSPRPQPVAAVSRYRPRSLASRAPA
jgi:DNA-binding PadR family transcriptional regulator